MPLPATPSLIPLIVTPGIVIPRLVVLVMLVSPLLVADVQTSDRVALNGSSPGSSPGSSSGSCRQPWSDPVDAPIVDFFRPPTHPYGPGNLGLEYRTVFEQPVAAVADGVVRFAGPVAGAPVVVIDHGANIWSTYTGLATGSVSRNQLLRAGEVLGQADLGFHLTARRHGSYLDPQLFLVESCDVVRLIDPPDL